MIQLHRDEPGVAGDVRPGIVPEARIARPHAPELGPLGALTSNPVIRLVGGPAATVPYSWPADLLCCLCARSAELDLRRLVRGNRMPAVVPERIRTWSAETVVMRRGDPSS